MTPKEKLEAVTPPEMRSSNSDQTMIFKLNIGLSKSSGCLPIDHRARNAPAEQELGLRHGKSKHSLLHSSQAQPFLNVSALPFNDEIFRMLITDLFRMRKHMWIFPLPSF